MLSGALVKLPEDLEINKLDGVVWRREERGQTLKSIIQFQGQPIKTRDITAQLAIAIHEKIVKRPILEEVDGKFSLSQIDVIEPSWANIYIVPGFVVVDSKDSRPFVRDIINKGLRLSPRAHDVFLNVAKMAQDHEGQWIRSFSDRRGRVDKGTVFGEGVEQDAVFGPELGRARSRTVGWITNFFGSPVKVRVSEGGSVTVWAWPPIELFLKFIKMEILPYMISLF